MTTPTRSLLWDADKHFGTIEQGGFMVTLGTPPPFVTTEKAVFYSNVPGAPNFKVVETPAPDIDRVRVALDAADVAAIEAFYTDRAVLFP